MKLKDQLDFAAVAKVFLHLT